MGWFPPTAYFAAMSVTKKASFKTLPPGQHVLPSLRACRSTQPGTEVVRNSRACQFIFILMAGDILPTGLLLFYLSLNPAVLSNAALECFLAQFLLSNSKSRIHLVLGCGLKKW